MFNPALPVIVRMASWVGWRRPGTVVQSVCGVLCLRTGASIQSAWLSGMALADRLAALRGKSLEQAQQLAIGLQDPFVPLAEATASAAEIGEFPGCKVPAAAPSQQRPQRQGQRQGQGQQQWQGQGQQQRQGQQQQRRQDGGGGPRPPQRQAVQQQRAPVL